MSALAVAPRWLVRLRWVAVGAEALAIGVAAFALGLELPLGTLFALVGLHALSNLVLAARRDRLDEAGWGGALLFDVWLLTALLAQSGSNFSFGALAQRCAPEESSWSQGAASLQ